ncbi:MAG TPA: hypothetical protein VMV47_14230 [Bacteroidales bacterium]|nr:hypothetical protein [Bacteroidales bacterium]
MNKETVITETSQKNIVCTGCSGRLQFVPGTNHLKCQSCGMENEIEVCTGPIEKLNLEEYLDEFEKKSEFLEAATIKCQGCGAQTTLAPNIISDFCPFCGSPQVVKNEGTTHGIKPQAILPFAVTLGNAYENYQAWIKKLFFVPNKFRKYVQQEGKLTGVYIPSWIYDADVNSDYTAGQGEESSDSSGSRNSENSVPSIDDGIEDTAYAQKIIALNEKMEADIYTITDNGFSVSKVLRYKSSRTENPEFKGHVDDSYNDVLVIASKSLPKHYAEKLHPWFLKKLVPFNERYLPGFKTETYQVGLKEGFADAKKKMNKRIELAVNGAIGTKNRRIYSIITTYSNVTFKHILLPVWISAYRHKKKTYRILVNGSTGTVKGERPFSWIKFVLFFTLIIAGFPGLMWLISIIVL